MRKLVLLTALLCPAVSYACTCFPYERKDVDNIINKADYVLIGKAISNVHPQKEVAEFLDTKLHGTQVLFKIDSVIKGDLTQDTVFINQYSEGNCSLSFDFGKSYMIIGYQIEEYKQVDDKSEDGIPPPPIEVENGMMKIPSSVVFPYDLYRNLTNRYITISTNECITFNVKSRLYQELFE